MLRLHWTWTCGSLLCSTECVRSVLSNRAALENNRVYQHKTDTHILLKHRGGLHSLLDILLLGILLGIVILGGSGTHV